MSLSRNVVINSSLHLDDKKSFLAKNESGNPPLSHSFLISVSFISLVENPESSTYPILPASVSEELDIRSLEALPNIKN